MRGVEINSIFFADCIAPWQTAGLKRTITASIIPSLLMPGFACTSHALAISKFCIRSSSHLMQDHRACVRDPVKPSSATAPFSPNFRATAKEHHVLKCTSQLNLLHSGAKCTITNHTGGAFGVCRSTFQFFKRSSTAGPCPCRSGSARTPPTSTGFF